MKVVILAGGRGTRLGDTTKKIPKPMIKLFRIPLLVHIINIYKRQGFKEFVILTGYKSKYIAEYFQNTYSEKNISVKCVFTGINTLTGSRILKIQKQIKEKDFFLTYGDGLANINIKKLLTFHKKNNNVATLTAVRKNLNFGILKISSNNKVGKFVEKPDNQMINGGFFVFSKNIFKYINKKKSLEFDCFPKLVKIKNLAGYKHKGFWQCLDNIKDKKYLEKKWKQKNCPWKNLK